MEYFFPNVTGGTITAGPIVESEIVLPEYSTDADAWSQNSETWTQTVIVPAGYSWKAWEDEIPYYTSDATVSSKKTISVNAVTITNTMTKHTLTVSKTVAGNMGSKDRYFPVSITVNASGVTASVPISLSNADISVPKTAYHNAMTNPESLSITNGTGSATVWLRHGQSVSLVLPEGASYSVNESGAEGYTTTYTVNGGAAQNGRSYSIDSLTENTEVAFTNRLDVVVPTGVNPPSVAPALIMFAAAVLLLFMLRWSRMRRPYDD